VAKEFGPKGKGESIFLSKLGTERELSPIVTRLAQILPDVRLLGIGVNGVPTSPHLEEVAHERQLTLGAFPEWWNRQLFVDPELYIKIQFRESRLLRMAERLTRHDAFETDRPLFPAEEFDSSFDNRALLLLRHVAFWDWVLREYHVTAVVAQNIPHNFWDGVLHAVAEAREIPFLYFHEVRPFLSSLYIYERLEEMGDLSRGKELIRSLHDKGLLTPDSQQRSEFMRRQTGINQARSSQDIGRRQVRSLVERARTLVYPPRHFPYKIRRTLRRRYRDYRSRSREHKVVNVNNPPSRYFLLELQVQGNATNLVKGFMFGDPREMIAYIAASLPEGCDLLVRESSRQGSRKQPRREYFWRQLSSIPGVKVASDNDSIDFLGDALGLIELGYSSLSLEAINLGIPVIMLGLTHMHGAPNTYPVTDHSSLSDALCKALESKSPEGRQNQNLQSALHDWADQTRASTLEGSLTSHPADRVDDPQFRERIINNVTQVVVAWYRSKTRSQSTFGAS